MTDVTELALEVYTETAHLYRAETNNWFAEAQFVAMSDGRWKAIFATGERHDSVIVIYDSFQDCVNECLDSAKTYGVPLVVEYKVKGDL